MKILFQFDPAEKERLRPILLEHIKHAESLGHPRFPRGTKRGPLAIVGGGPSIRNHIERLMYWPGEIWAVNGAWNWCREHDIDATFFSVDPAEGVAELCRGARKAILSYCVHPSVFKSLARETKIIAPQVYMVPTPPHPETVGCGPTTASTAPDVATKMGYSPITFFGCESSYVPEVGTHAYMDEPQENLMIVTCGDRAFATEPEYISQAECLSEIIRKFPDVFKEESGGLLRAMVEIGPEWDCVATQPGMAERLTYPNGTVGGSKEEAVA